MVPSSTEKGTLICTQCGESDTRPGVQFCRKCGGKLKALPPAGSTTESRFSSAISAPEDDKAWPEASAPPDPKAGRTYATIWAAVKVYYIIDAIFAFFVALISLILSLVLSGAIDNGNACDFAQVHKIGYIIVFSTRCLDMCMGCCDFCSSDTGRFGVYCLRNLLLSCFQCLLGCMNTLYAALDAILCLNHLAWITFAFGILLVVTAAEEIYIWAGVYFLYRASKHSPPPQWAEEAVSSWADRLPDCFVAYIDRHK